jgi:DNA-directed RNA polymerase subunit RPC12/RpoP
MENAMVSNYLAVRLADPQSIHSYRPWMCPYCGSSLMQRWGKAMKPAWNPNKLELTGHRYRCLDCERTFRAYSDGGTPNYPGQDIRRLAVMAWATGLSLSSVVDLFGENGVNLSRSTVWRAGQDLLGGTPTHEISVTVTAAEGDSDAQSLAYRWADLAVLLEIGRRKTVRLHLATEESAAELQAWVRSLAGELELEIYPGG